MNEQFQSLYGTRECPDKATICKLSPLIFFFVPVLQIVPSLRRWNLSLIAHYYFNTVKHDFMKALLKFFTVLLKLQKL